MVTLTTAAMVRVYTDYTASRMFHRETELIRAIARKRPDHASKAEWEHFVGSTLNMHQFCNVSDRGFPHARYRRYVAELERRVVADKMSVDDIDWIWWTYTELNSACAGYVDENLPTTPQSRRTAHEGKFGIVAD